MQFIRTLIIVFSSLIISKLYAGELGAKLNAQIELLPSCLINNNSVTDGTTNVNLGMVDFGDTTASFNGVLESSLVGDSGSGIQIQCSGVSQVKLTFGSGRNDGNVPLSYTENYYHALTNGADFVAYNLLYGKDRLVIKPNDFFIIDNVSQLQVVNIFGRAINDGTRISMGYYNDMIPVIVEF